MSALKAATLAVLVAAQVHAADFIIQNSNRPTKGFNDRTPVEPAGLNFATTRGGQAQLAFRAAGAIWGATLRSATPIVIDAAFATAGEDPTFSCDDPTRVVLGFARRSGQLSDPTFPKPGGSYPFALANALAGKNLIGTRPAIFTRFNAELGTPRCKGFDAWDFSLDKNGLTLLSTLMHEFGHGLGFASALNPTLGTFTEGGQAFDYQVWDVTTPTPQSWLTSGPEARKTLAITPAGIVLNGPNVTRDTPRYLGFAPEMKVQFDGADAGVLDYVPGAFSGTVQGGGVVALANPADGCAPLGQGSLEGKVALIRRGTCTFLEKAARAVDAGAIAMVVSNNEGGYIQMAPAKPALEIPAVLISQEAGAQIEAAMAGGVASVQFVSGEVRSNANATGVYLYTPPTLEGGSSVSHFNTGSYPRALLMQPASHPSTVLNLDLTGAAMADMGWSVVNGLTLSIVKALEAPLTSGQDSEYLVAIINRRATTIDSVGLEITGPGATTVTSYRGGCTSAPCSLGLMRAGDTVFVVVTVKPGPGLSGDFVVQAKLTPSSADAEDNLVYTATTPIASGGDLKVTVIPPAKLEPGVDAVFTTKIVNDGPSTATEVAATVTLVAADGSALTVTGDCSGPEKCILTQLGNSETWEFATTFAVPKDFNKKVTFTATVSSYTPDSNEANNTASTSSEKGGCSSLGGADASMLLAAFAVLAVLRARMRG